MVEISNKNEKNGRGIVLFCNKKYLFALGAFLLNLQKYVYYDGIMVYHDDIDDKEQNAIRKIEPKVRFIKYGLDEFVREFSLDKEKVEKDSFIERYTVLAVVKFKILQHLKDFSTVILFDLDMILLSDIEEVLRKDFDIAWKNETTIRGKLNWRGYSDDYIKKLGMYEIYNRASTPNAGFMVVKRTFDYNKAYEVGAKYLREYGFVHPVHIDEFLLGYIREVMQLNAYYVDDKVYNAFPDVVSMKSKLVHFLTDYKPWNSRTVQAVFKDWKSNYDKFVDITGMTSSAVIDYSNISECLLQAHFSKKWGELFHKHRFIYPDELKLQSDLLESKLEFSYYGIFSYNIETTWLIAQSYCVCWFDKRNISTPVQIWKDKLHRIEKDNSNFVKYLEGTDGFGLKTVGKLLQDIPDAFYKLYEITADIRKNPLTIFTQIRTYHGTKLYIDYAERCLKHADDCQGGEIYASINGSKVALFVSATGMNIYVKEIDKDGRVSMTKKQTFFRCWHNADRSISIEIGEGSMVSADEKGKITLKHWNREWEHFFMQIISSIIE